MRTCLDVRNAVQAEYVLLENNFYMHVHLLIIIGIRTPFPKCKIFLKSENLQKPHTQS
jgi:hypothetical protein